MTADVWMQHPTPALAAQPMFDSLRRWVGELAADPPVSRTLAALDEAGLQWGLLSAWYGPGGALVSNDEVAALVAAHPDRFRGVAGVDLRDPVAALRELTVRIRDDGFVALRIVQWLWELPCTHRLYYPLLARCVELGVPVCLQVGLTGPLRSSETGRPGHIERIALDFPDLTIVCGHIGYPWHEEMIAYATKFPNVYIDTSAYKVRRYPPELVAFMQRHGRRKVMFGSNYPMIAPAAALADLDALGLDAEARDLFLGGNAARVFGLGAKASAPP